MKINAQDVLSFWFGQWPFDPQAAAKRAKMWFSSSEETDQAIEQQFGPQVNAALAGSLNPTDSIEDQLAFIILTDQFTRNIFRKTAKAFSGDTLALAKTQSLIENNHHLTLPPPVACFACMPLQHSEDKAIQKQSLEIFQAIANHASDSFQNGASENLKYAELHAKIINEFGRFPHRNAVLGRANTAEEEAYLNGDAHRFGQ